MDETEGLMIFNIAVALFTFRSNIHARNLENIKKHKGPNKQTKPELIPPLRQPYHFRVYVSDLLSV